MCSLCSNFFICSNIFFICSNFFLFSATFLFATTSFFICSNIFYLYRARVQCLICGRPFLCSDPCGPPKANFKQENWKVNLTQKWTCNLNSLFEMSSIFPSRGSSHASVICFCLSDFASWGLNSTTWKKKSFEFLWRCYFNTLIAQKGSLNSEI